MEIESNSSESISLPWKWRPVRRRMLPGCELFAEGDKALHTVRKFIPLEDETFGSESSQSYENHYNSVHRHVCASCKRIFPSSFLLDIHIEENHDPLFAILAAKQAMYRCLVQSCIEKCICPEKRRDHLITVHKFPTHFRFHRDRHRKKKNSSTCCGSLDLDNSPKCSKAEKTEKLTEDIKQSIALTDENTNLAFDMSDKENVQASVSKETSKEQDTTPLAHMDITEPGGIADDANYKRVFVCKVPHNFSFGHGVSRGFQRSAGNKKNKGKHWHQKFSATAGSTNIDIETVDMKDMTEALNDLTTQK